MDDPIIQRIECFRCSRGTLHAERRNRGYTLYRARSGALVARLRPTGSDDRFEVLYWSLWKDRWASTGPFGRTVLSIDDALRFIAHEDLLGYHLTATRMKNAESRAESGGIEGAARYETLMRAVFAAVAAYPKSSE
jgi:hypothetical protein